MTIAPGNVWRTRVSNVSQVAMEHPSAGRHDPCSRTTAIKNSRKFIACLTPVAHCRCAPFLCVFVAHFRCVRVPVVYFRHVSCLLALWFHISQACNAARQNIVFKTRQKWKSHRPQLYVYTSCKCARSHVMSNGKQLSIWTYLVFNWTNFIHYWDGMLSKTASRMYWISGWNKQKYVLDPYNFTTNVNWVKVDLTIIFQF